MSWWTSVSEQWNTDSKIFRIRLWPVFNTVKLHNGINEPGAISYWDLVQQKTENKNSDTFSQHWFQNPWVLAGKADKQTKAETQYEVDSWEFKDPFRKLSLWEDE